MLWNKFKDSWFHKTQALVLFLVSTALVIAETPLLLGLIPLTAMPFWQRLPWGILAILGPIALFFLWIGMWRYWVRLDTSPRWLRRLWFFLLLFGLWWASCLYCLLVYLPQTTHKNRVEA